MMDELIELIARAILQSWTPAGTGELTFVGQPTWKVHLPEAQAALATVLPAALNPEMTDCEIEAALTGEGIYVWGPDGDRFVRMFAIVMAERLAALSPEAAQVPQP